VAHREAPRWLVRRRPSAEVAEVAARLFCFPYLGGDGSEFETWAEDLHPGIELYTIDLPELGGPHAELLANPEVALRTALLPELAELTELPFAIYGHSIGGFMALELAEVIAKELGRAPLFVALGALPKEELTHHGVLRNVTHPDEISDVDIVRFCEHL